MAKSHVLVSAHVALYINGQLFGRVSSFSYTSTTPKKSIYGIDAVDPFELAVTTTKISGSMSVYRMSGDGGAEGAGITAPYTHLPNEKYFSITLIEHHRDLVIFEASQCSLISQSWEHPARGHVKGAFAFEAISFSNEVRPAAI